MSKKLIALTMNNLEMQDGNKMLIVDKLRLSLEFGEYVELNYEILDKVCELIGKDTSKFCKPYPWDSVARALVGSHSLLLGVYYVKLHCLL